MKISARNIVAVLALLVLVIYGALKGVIYLRYNGAMEELAKQVRLFASLRHESVTSSLLDKTVTIHKLTLLPVGLDDGLNIDSMTIQAPDLGTLLSGFSSHRSAQLPEQLDISLNGLKIDLNGAIVDKLEQVSSQAGSGSAGVIQTACGGKLRLELSDYRAMGYDVLDTSMRFAYQYTASGLRLAAQWSAKELGSLTIDTTLSGFERLSASELANTTPQLEELSIDYDDYSYTRRANEYCAKLTNRSMHQYIDAAVNQSDAVYLLKWGFIPGASLKQAYKTFLTNPESISISMTPPAGFNQQSISMYKESELLSALNLKVKVNGQPVNNPTLSLTPSDNSQPADGQPSLQQRFFAFRNLLTPGQDKPVVSEKPQEKKAEQTDARYQVVSLSRLPGLLGNKVRVHTENGQVHAGELSKITATTVNVTQNVHAGQFTMNINKETIKKVEVLLK